MMMLRRNRECQDSIQCQIAMRGLESVWNVSPAADGHLARNGSEDLRNAARE